MRGLTSFLVVVLVGGAVQAQETRPASARRTPAAVTFSEQVSPRELRYGGSLAESLAQRRLAVLRMSQAFDVPGSPERRVAHGVTVRLEGGLEVDRVLLPSEQAAFEYGLYGFRRGTSEQDLLIQARGRQVVVVRGRGLGLEQIESTRRLRQAAWNAALPAPSAKLVSLDYFRNRSLGSVSLSASRQDPQLKAKLERRQRQLRDDFMARNPDSDRWDVERKVVFQGKDGRGYEVVVLSPTLWHYGKAPGRPPAPLRERASEGPEANRQRPLHEGASSRLGSLLE